MELISQINMWLCVLCLISPSLASFIIPSDIDSNDVITKTEVDQMKNNLRRKWRLNLRRDPLTISHDNLIEGDILPDNYLTPEILKPPVAQDKIMVSTPTRMWHEGIVPYTFSGAYTFMPWERYMIKQTMKDMERRSCIKFVERTNEQDYVKFIYDRNRCYSQIGRSGGMQYVSLGFLCMKLWNRAAAYHELLHVLGFFHEHTRPDRDDHVEINWKYVKPRDRKNFDKRQWHEIHVDTPYDIESIMHYGPYAFSMFSYLTPTMKSRKHGIEYPRLNKPSTMDYEKLNRMYLCHGHGRSGYSGIGYVGPSVQFLKEHRLPLLDPFNKDVTLHTHRLIDDTSSKSKTDKFIPVTFPPTNSVKYGSRTTVDKSRTTSLPRTNALTKYLEAPHLTPGSLIPLRLPGFREATQVRQRTTQKSSFRESLGLPGFREATQVRQITTPKSSMRESRRLPGSRESRMLTESLTEGPIPVLLPPPSPGVKPPARITMFRKMPMRRRNINADARTSTPARRGRPLRRAVDRPRPNDRN